MRNEQLDELKQINVPRAKKLLKLVRTESETLIGGEKTERPNSMISNQDSLKNL